MRYNIFTPVWSYEHLRAKSSFLFNLEKFLIHAAEQIDQKKMKDKRTEEIIEFLSNEYPEGRLLVADYYSEISEKLNEGFDSTITMLKSFIESTNDNNKVAQVWQRILSIYKKDGNVTGQIKTIHAMSQNTYIAFSALSECANELNRLHKIIIQYHESLTEEWKYIAKKLIEILSVRESEASATDFSRIAWLSINIGDTQSGIEYAEKGLHVDPNNEYCQSIRDKLTVR